MRKLKLREGTNTAVLFGHHDRHLKLIEEDLGVRLSARGEELTLDGTPDATRHAERVLTELATLANDGMVLQPDDITHALSALRQSPETPIKELLSNATTIVTKKRFVAPKTPTQKLYRSDRNPRHCHRHRSGRHRQGLSRDGDGGERLDEAGGESHHLAKPAVEAGEKLGFLPGDMIAKVNPYHVRSMTRCSTYGRGRATPSSEETLNRPAGFMRGRTLVIHLSFSTRRKTRRPTNEMFLTGSASIPRPW